MRAMSLKLPEGLEARLAHLAHQRGVTRSALVREAVEALLARQPHADSGSVADLAKDLIGSVEGPGSLSHDPRHMKGYGR